jgi:zinc transport system substrate-binding protein
MSVHGKLLLLYNIAYKETPCNMPSLTYCFTSNILRSCLIVFIFCLGKVQASEAEQILTSIKPLALIASEITAGTGLNTGYLLAPSVSEHNYALKMSDIKRLHSASLVIWLGKDAEPYLDSSKSNWLGSGSAKKSLALLTALAPALHKVDKHKEGHDHGGLDPHVWISPVLAGQLAGQIANRLGEIYPEHKEQFASNLTKFSDKIATLDAITAKNLAPYSETPFFVHHDAYGYFVEHYRLNQVGVMRIQPEEALSLKQLRALQLTLNKQAGPSCLFHEPQLSRVQLPVFERGSVVTGELDPLGIDASSFNELIDNLTKGFLKCFEQKKD